MIKPILISPEADNLLRSPSSPVMMIDASIRDLVADMQETLRQAYFEVRGINGRLERYKAGGLVAVQIGKPKNVVVIEDTDVFSWILINPEVVKAEHPHLLHEACLSLPGKVWLVERPKIVKVKYLGLDGQQHAVKGRDGIAQCLMHEIDHLHGIMIDKIAKEK